MGVYKDIHAVMAAQTDLVEVLGQFDPKLVKMCPVAGRADTDIVGRRFTPGLGVRVFLEFGQLSVHAQAARLVSQQKPPAKKTAIGSFS